jgi:hypothetical protein
VSTIEVKIEVDNGVIVCNVKDGKVKGGNVKGSSGDEVHFIGNGVKFSLGFVSFPGGDAAWPFQGPTQPSFPGNPPPPSSFWPQPQFKATLATPPTPPAYYKYTVNVAGAPPLDPIIIVDKR